MIEDEHPCVRPSHGSEGRRPPSLGPRPRQATHIVFCQVCGRSTPPESGRADGWLIERWRVDPALWVVRCYAHISEWALRSSAAGRTKEWRQRAQDGRIRAQNEPAPLLPWAAPLPVDGPSGLPDDSSVDYTLWWEEEDDE